MICARCGSPMKKGQYVCLKCGKTLPEGRSAEAAAPKKKRRWILIAVILLAVTALGAALAVILVNSSSGRRSSDSSYGGKTGSMSEPANENILDKFFTEGYYIYKCNEFSDLSRRTVYGEITVKKENHTITNSTYMSASFAFYDDSGTRARYDAYDSRIIFSDYDYKGPALGGSCSDDDCYSSDDTVELRFLWWQYPRSAPRGHINRDGSITPNHTEKMVYRDGDFYTEDGEKLTFSKKSFDQQLNSGSIDNGKTENYLMSDAEKACLE